MADNNKQDPLIESLMALAVSAAPLIRRARESGMFKAGSREDAASESVVEATVNKPEPAPAPEANVDFSAEKAALQDIIVNQAMKIAALEAEIAKLKAASAKPKRAGKA
ncbi:MAG: hypothetical protein H7268_03590 [Sandarakinorhabdus sp.]|nr:hypothetical protein [Sandarakinorhabdus sp.]